MAYVDDQVALWTPNNHWKITDDPFYGPQYLWEYDGKIELGVDPWMSHDMALRSIIYAGFFFETSPSERPPDTVTVDRLDKLLLCTPINFLKQSKSSDKVVLLTSGSFAPIHNGHIEMMEAAKKAIERTGAEVIGGYISPSHDEYVQDKIKNKSITVIDRLNTINELIKDIPWLAADPWEGVFNPRAINFTKVIARLKKYLAYHFDPNVRVVFVAGADNAGFNKIFKWHGDGCVIVGRNHEFFQEKPYALFAPLNNPASSTSIRKDGSYTAKSTQARLHLRLTKEDANRELLYVLKPRFSSLKTHSYFDQSKIAHGSLSVKNLVSLDSQIEMSHNLAVSRLYDWFGVTKLGYTNRPGTHPLEYQIEQLPPQCYLFDDDIASGNTMRFVEKLLNEHDRVVLGISTLIISKPDEEILDSRDFYLDIENSGLVVSRPHNPPMRVPYMYPYVNPAVRCSVADPLEFSIELWEMNKRIAESDKLFVKDCPSYQSLFYMLGFNDNDSVVEVCEWHLKKLRPLRK